MPKSKKQTYEYIRDKKYGFEPGQYDQMYAEQAGACAICEQEHDRLFVDHDHSNGFVRGLLCQYCNSMLGMAKDNPLVLQLGAAYLLKQQDIYPKFVKNEDS